MDAFINDLCARISRHAASATPLVIRGGNTKAFYGRAVEAETLDMRGWAGIIDYEPRELVLTVRAGTPLAEIEAVMAAERQMLPFEPPHYGPGATIGGTVASGLSGPRRAYSGAVRDFVLGARIVNGKGEDLRFGGRVIKNVAGYDVSRLMCGALGTLGVLLDLSFKVLPLPAADCTLRFECNEANAITRLNAWAGQPLPLSASSWHDGELRVRLSGAVAGVNAARNKLGGELHGGSVTDASTDAAWWADLRDQRAAFFAGPEPLWRLSVPSTTPALALGLPTWIEWGGALRWVRGVADAAAAQALREKIAAVGGHATLFRPGAGEGVAADAAVPVFHPLPPTLARIHRNLKAAFDPVNILNPGRLDNF